MSLVNIDSIYYWHGKPILNLDQRNEVEAHLRTEIAECKVISEADVNGWGTLPSAWAGARLDRRGDEQWVT